MYKFLNTCRKILKFFDKVCKPYKTKFHENAPLCTAETAEAGVAVAAASVVESLVVGSKAGGQCCFCPILDMILVDANQ